MKTYVIFKNGSIVRDYENRKNALKGYAEVKRNSNTNIDAISLIDVSLGLIIETC